MQPIPSSTGTCDRSVEDFSGFEPLTGNFLYCPNQFFDVCLSTSSRGVVRLVAYILRKTLGWLDEQGHPIEQDISLSYRDFVADAGISRGAIRQVVEEALASGFISCSQQGTPNTNGESGQTASFTLRWSTDDHYVKAPEAFPGFYAGEGHRSPIPNAFFDYVVRFEPLAVIKVVGTVLRHTVGYQNQFGGRRSDASLSNNYIRQYSNISGRRTLTQALQRAIHAGYVQCVDAGSFDPRIGPPTAATYAVRWHDEANLTNKRSKRSPREAFKKESQGSVQKGVPQQFKKQSQKRSKRSPREAFKKESLLNTQVNNTSKQQHVVAVDELKIYELLQQQGIEGDTTRHLLQISTPEQIEQQITWLPLRHPASNPQGMLRKAIEQNWSQPVAAKEQEKQEQSRLRQRKQQEQEAVEREQEVTAKRKRLAYQKALLRQWNAVPPDQQSRYFQTAIEQANSVAIRSYLRRHQDTDNPPTEVLRVMANEHPVGVGD